MARGSSTSLNVFLNGRLVGRLAKATTGAIEFQYDKTWLDWSNAIPVSLSLALREDRYVGDPVIAVFDNLLPESDPVRRRLAQGAEAEGTDAYSLLSAVGRDCIGALQFLLDDEKPLDPKEIKSRPMTDAEIADKLRGLAQNPLGIESDEDFRISLAGVQDKTALLKLDGRWHLPISTTPTTHILKPQIGKVGDGIDFTQSVENEFLCLKLVAAFGIPVNEATIDDFEDKRVLTVTRFDRLWTTDKRLLRIPQEDFCQSLSVAPSKKYENEGGPGIKDIARLLKRSDKPEHDLSIFFKSQIAFWLLAAIDGHAKNFSVHLASGGSFALAPLYDIVSVQPGIDAQQLRKRQTKLAMALGDNRHYRLEEINRHHFIQTGALAEIPKNVVKNSIEQFLDEGATVIDKTVETLPAGFPAQIAESITKAAKDRLGNMSRT